MQVAWKVPGFGTFAYPVRLTAVEGARRVARALARDAPCTPSSAATRGSGRRSIVRGAARSSTAAAGRSMTERSVVDVGVEVDKARAATAERIAGLVDVDADELQQRIEAAPKGRFLPVITLRAAAFAKVEDELTVVPGVSLNRTKASLAPSSTFARTLLGTVGPVTAEQIEESDGRLSAGDDRRPVGARAPVRRSGSRARRRGAC